MKKLPHYYTRRWFVSSILLLSAMGFAYRLLLTGEAAPTALLRLTLPLLMFWALYQLEYHHRILEQVCRVLKKCHIFYILLPMFIGGIAAIFHHNTFLNWFLPLGFLVCQWVMEKEEHATFDARLICLLVQYVLFLGLSLKLTHHGAAAATVAVMGIVLLLRLVVLGSQKEWDFWKGVSGLAIMVLWVGALCADLLQRLLFIAVPEELYRITGACMDLFTAVRPWGQAELILSNFSDLLPYAPGYLAASFGWLSLVPLVVVIGQLIVSGFWLCFRGLPRHTSTLAVGCYLLLVFRIVSFFSTGFSIVVGFDGLPFFDSAFIDMVLAVLILQPLNPKPLSELSSDDPDFDLQEVCALILLPRNREGAEVLSRYLFDTHNYVGWTVLIKQYWRFFNEAERRALLLNSADVFGTHDHLKKIHPEYYKEESSCIISNS